MASELGLRVENAIGGAVINGCVHGIGSGLVKGGLPRRQLSECDL